MCPVTSRTQIHLAYIFLFVYSQQKRSPGCPAPQQMKGGDRGAEARLMLLIKHAHDSHRHIE